MTRPTKYDDDGVRAKPEEKRPEYVLARSGAIVVVGYVISLALLCAAIIVNAESMSTLEHRIDYDRTREVEWFHRLNTQLFELGVEAVETRQALARAIKAYHPGGVTAKAYMTDTEFYGKVTFYGPVEFIPEEE